MSWIQIDARNRWDFSEDAEPEDRYIDMQSVARSLSRQVRYVGHGEKIVTVAEHCINVAEFLEPQYQIYGLMHDAAEAVIGDINRPFKSLFPVISRAEEDICKDIYQHIGLWPVPAHVQHMVDYFDRIALVLEGREIFGHQVVKTWPYVQDILQDAERYRLAIRPEALSRQVLEVVWLDHFKPYMAAHLQHGLGSMRGEQ